MLRRWIAILVLIGLGLLGRHLALTDHASGVVFAKSRAMERTLSEDAGAIGYRVVAERYPFSPEAYEARARLWHLAGAPAADGRPAGMVGPAGTAGVWKESFVQAGDPYVTGLSLAAVAALLCLMGGFLPRSRVRGRSIALLILLAAAVVLTQTDAGLEALRDAAPRLGAQIYAAFPWIAAGLLCVMSLLLALASQASGSQRARRAPRYPPGWAPPERGARRVPPPLPA